MRRMADCITDFAIPQPTEWERVGDKIDTAMIGPVAEYRKPAWGALRKLTVSFSDLIPKECSPNTGSPV